LSNVVHNPTVNLSAKLAAVGAGAEVAAAGTVAAGAEVAAAGTVAAGAEVAGAATVGAAGACVAAGAVAAGVQAASNKLTASTRSTRTKYFLFNIFISSIPIKSQGFQFSKAKCTHISSITITSFAS
jgi:hypothetical protein